MSDLASVQAVLVEYGRANGLDGFALDETGALAFSVDDALHLFQYNAELDALVLIAALGAVPEEARESVFGKLLAANLFWAETGGCTLAFESQSEQAVLQYSLSGGGLTAARLGEAFDGLRGFAAEWRERLAGWVREDLEGQGIVEFVDQFNE